MLFSSIGMQSLAFASDELKTTVVISEYEELEKLSKMSDIKLRSIGYNIAEINDIKNFEAKYNERFYTLKKEPDNVLRNYGYTDKQISIIRNFDGKEIQVKSLVAKVTLTLTSSGVTWNSSTKRSNTNLKASFTWSSMPLVRLIDGLGITWNDWTRSSYTSSVTYKKVSNGATFNKTPTFVNNAGPQSMGCGFKFSCMQDPNNEWLISGTMNIVLYYSNVKKALSGYAAYGHTTLGWEPSFSIPGGGAIGFGFQTQTIAEDWCDRVAPK